MLEFDPYADNMLVEGLGPVRSRLDWAKQLSCVPILPPEARDAPRHLRLFALARLRDLYFPRREVLRITDSIELALRESYRYRDPRAPATWATVAAEPLLRHAKRTPAQAIVVGGHSGTGKTESILRILASYPQLIHHERFPFMASDHTQVTWLSANVPASGKAAALAEALMIAWHSVFENVPDYIPRFAKTLSQAHRPGDRMLAEWRQVASSHFLGILHLDEVQNLFKLPSLKERTRKKRSTVGRPEDEIVELSIIEDQALRGVLDLMNCGIALILSGTPDGVNALMRRLATAERAVMGGYHILLAFAEDRDQEFEEFFLPALVNFQCVAHPLVRTPQLAGLLIELTAGIPRLLVALWIAAHRVAFEHRADALTEADIRKAAATYLDPVMPAVNALRSNSPRLMRRYEDLLPIGWDIWSEVLRPF